MSLLRPYSYYSPYVDYLDTEAALRRSRIATDIAVNSALRRSRVETELALTRIDTSNALRRSRLAADLELSRVERDIALRDSVRRLRDAEVDLLLSRRY